MFGFSGCSKAINTAAVNTPNKSAAVKKDEKINLNKLNITLPLKWTKRGNENEMFFYDEKEQAAGGIRLIGYYGDYNSTLPNHSKIVASSDEDTALGAGKIFTLSRDNPAASGNSETWTEIHGIIPAGNNLAYDIWVKGEKDILMNILKNIKE